jgi:hypothetical protein
MLSTELNELPSNRAVVLDNITCPYCGIEINDDNDSKEHVIGRRFVPKGTLNGSWNLIVRACKKCNSEKSHLENDISAITLASKVWFGSDNSETNIEQEALRKAQKSISHKTRKPVIHSHEELNFEVPFSPGATFKFNMVSPPQIASNRLYELARMQMMAFFYFITFNNETKRGGFWQEGFHPLSEAHHGDWGNPLLKAFMSAVVNWEPRWIANTADGFFRSIIRRHPSAECWSWAVEWNKNYRVVGFFGARNAAQKIVDDFREPEMTAIITGKNAYLRFRSDFKLHEEDDLLFVWSDECP